MDGDHAETAIKAILSEGRWGNTCAAVSVEVAIEEVDGLVVMANSMLSQPTIPVGKREMFGVALGRLNEALYRFTRDILLVEGNPNEIRRRLGEG